MLELRRTRFLLSAASLAQLPPDVGAELAFAGRSNAGKSSAINRIADQKGLARVAKTPGRTQLLNVFVFPQGRLVDLPGYGYAKVAADVRGRWQGLVSAYLDARASLKGVVLVMDARHPLTELDMQLLSWCKEGGLPVHVLLSKADKLGRGAGTTALAAVRKTLGGLHPGASAQLFSATAGTGRDLAIDTITAWLGHKKAPDQGE